MKKNWRRKLNILVTIIMSFLVVILLGRSENLSGKISFINTVEFASAASNETKDETHEDSANVDTAYGENVSIVIDYGYNHYAKYGRYMNVSTTITNDGEAFEGWVQIIVPKAENNVVYRKEIIITSKSTQTISLTIPVVDDTGRLQVNLLDSNQKTIIEKICKIKIGNYEEQAYIGVLSDQREKLEYLNTAATKMFYLDVSDIPKDYTGLDLLDVLVIDHFNTNQLSDKQLEAIDKWVNLGGTLVIGTGEYSNETLAKLGAAYSITTSGIIRNYDITFGLNDERLEELKQDILDYQESRKQMLEVIKNRNEMIQAYGNQPIEIENKFSEYLAQDTIDHLKLGTINKNILEVKLEDGTTEVEEYKSKLLQMRGVGQGMVQLFSFNLALEQEDKTLGLLLLTSITENMSSMKQEQLQQEYYGEYINYGINNSISYTDTKNVPKIVGYIIILVVYIFVVGPITYLILRKLDKRSLTWVIVPALALIFTVLIYILGSDTRITKPYVGYVELLTFGENNRVENKTYFALTAPYNYRYSVELDKEYVVNELNNGNYNYYMNSTQPKKNANLEKYMTSINFDFNKTILEVNNNPAFSPVYYQTKSTYSMENQLTCDIHYLGDQIYGTVTNGFDFDLSNAILMSDGYLINIGAIGQGETISIEGKESVFLTTRDIFYNNDIINRIVGGTGDAKDNTATINRKSNLLYFLGENNLLNISSNNYLIGFIDESDQDLSVNMESQNMIEELSQKMDSYGTKVVMIPVEVDYVKENQVFVPSIDSYMKWSDANYDSYYSYRYLDSDNKTVEFQLPEDDKIVSFEYLKARNQEFDSEYQRGFEGDIFFLNNVTGSFDQVFKAGVGCSVTNVSDYLSEQNTVTIRYSANISSQGYQMLLPYISYWKEADTDVKY